MSSYPLHELRRLLGGSSVVRGVVVRVAGNAAQVATANGLMRVSVGGTLAAGQACVVRDGAAYPAAKAGAVYAL